MKKIKYFSLIGLVASLMFSSCSVEKRHYMGGYNIVKHNVISNADKKEALAKNTTIKTEATEIPANKDFEEILATNTLANEEVLTASTEEMVIVLSTPKLDFSNNETEAANTINASETNKNTNAAAVKAIVKKQLVKKTQSRIIGKVLKIIMLVLLITLAITVLAIVLLV